MNARLLNASIRGAIRLTHLPVLLGRSDEADVRLDDRWVSRRHCQILARNGVLVVKDLGSKHGTWVNHRRVEEAMILPGDELAVGVTSLRAEYEISEVH